MGINKINLFYGTPNKIVVPTYGKGEEKHDLELELAVQKVGNV